MEVQGSNLLIDTSDTTYASTYATTSEDANTSSLLFNDPYAGLIQVQNIPFGAAYVGTCPEKLVDKNVTEIHEFEYVATPMNWTDAESYAEANDVITSYSIHYTKLYERWQGR